MISADFSAILPEVVLVLYAMAALLGAVYTGKDELAGTLTWATVAVFTGLAAWIGLSAPGETIAFGGMFVDDAFARFAKVTVLLGAAAVLAMSADYMARRGLGRFEFPLVVALAVAGMMIMVSAGDLMSLYMGLELQSLSLYILAAFRRDSVKSTEAGLKYFVLGSLSSGLLLYGASLTYGFTGTTLFSGIIETIQGGHVSVGLLFGLVLMITGLAFKVSAVPFHMWTPDVYEGSPTPVTAFFATAPKVAAVAMFARGSVRRVRRRGGRLAADPVLPVARLDVPRRGRRDRAAQHQAADGLFLDRPHGLRADGSRRGDRLGGAVAAHLPRDLRHDERRHLRLHPQHGEGRQAGRPTSPRSSLYAKVEPARRGACWS